MAGTRKPKSRSGREEALRKQYAKDKGGGGTYYLVNEDALKELRVEKMVAKEGKNFLAIMPQQNDPVFYRHIEVHYDVGGTKNAYICGASIGKKCPVCNYREKMKKDGEPDEVLKDLKASSRYLFFVVDVKDRAGRLKGLRLLDAPWTVWKETMAQATDDRTGDLRDISDPDVNKNIVFEREGTSFTTKYNGFKLERRRKPLADKLFALVPDFDDVIQPPNLKAMKADLEGYEIPDEEEVDDEVYDDEVEDDGDYEEDEDDSDDEEEYDDDDDSDDHDDNEYDEDDEDEDDEDYDDDDEEEEDDPPRRKKSKPRRASKNAKSKSKSNVRGSVKSRRAKKKRDDDDMPF